MHIFLFATQNTGEWKCQETSQTMGNREDDQKDGRKMKMENVNIDIEKDSKGHWIVGYKELLNFIAKKTSAAQKAEIDK